MVPGPLERRRVNFFFFIHANFLVYTKQPGCYTSYMNAEMLLVTYINDRKPLLTTGELGDPRHIYKIYAVAGFVVYVDNGSPTQPTRA